MITLHTLKGDKVLVNPVHVIMVKTSENTFGESYVELYHSAAKAPLTIKESLNDVHSILHQYYRNN